MGSAARFAVHDLSVGFWHPGFPWDTLFVNVSGSLLIGYLAGRLQRLPDSSLRPLMMAGFCGGYTTFSMFSLESLQLLEREPWLGGLYTAANVLLSLLGVGVGWMAAQPRSSGSRA